MSSDSRCTAFAPNLAECPSITISVRKDAVFAIAGNAYVDLQKTVLSFYPKEKGGMYMTGPAGIGKSHILYVLVSQLR